MSHTLAVGDDGTPAAGEPAREANLLGTVWLAVSERVDGAVELAAGHGGAAPAALSALATYLDGSSIDALRRALGIEAIDQLVGAHRTVGAQGEHREHPSLLASSQWERPAVDERIGAAEDADLYGQLTLASSDDLGAPMSYSFSRASATRRPQSPPFVCPQP